MACSSRFCNKTDYESLLNCRQRNKSLPKIVLPMKTCIFERLGPEKNKRKERAKTMSAYCEVRVLIRTLTRLMFIAWRTFIECRIVYVPTRILGIGASL